MPTIKVVDIELSRPLEALEGFDGFALQGLVRLHGTPIGYVQIPTTGDRCSANALAHAILAECSQNIVRQLVWHQVSASFEGFSIEKLLHLPPPPASYFHSLTVVVCIGGTEGDSRSSRVELTHCFTALLRLGYPSLEILAVDCAPNQASETLVQNISSEIRYLGAYPGLNEARNQALREAQGEIVAYIDDKVLVDSKWAQSLNSAFSDPEVMTVTGLIVPNEIAEKGAEKILERQINVYGQGFERQRYCYEQDRRHYRSMVSTRNVGVETNMAFRRSVFNEIGNFNPALDRESSGGALEIFFRVLNAGHTLLYEPSVLVRHQQVWDRTWLRTQAFRQSLGLFTYFLSSAQTNREKRLAFTRVGFWCFRCALRSWVRPYGLPRHLFEAELQGYVTALRRYGELAKPAVPASDRPLAKTERLAVREVSLDDLQALENVTDYEAVRVFVTQRNRLLGSVDIINHQHPISPTRLRAAIAEQLWLELLPNRSQSPKLRLAQVEAALAQFLIPPEEEIPRLPAEIPVSIVIATYDRPDDLQNCLSHVLAQKTPRPVEVIVADNHPASGLTAPVVAQFPEVKLIGETRKGAAYARNAGFAASSGEIIVSVDDDVTVPSDWLEKLLVPFERKNVVLVTGNVLPIELETSAQYLFEKTHNGLSQGLDPFEVDGNWLDSFHYSPPVWELGVSANAAYRATMFSDAQVGLMSEIVSTGTPAGGGEEPYLFYKLLKAGYTLVYEPSAYVWHRHRRDLPSLRRQMFNYSKSCIAYHLAIWLGDRDLRGMRQLVFDLPGYYVRKSYERLLGLNDCPWSLIGMEVAGYFAGPLALWRSYRNFQRTGPSEPYVPVSERGAAEAHSKTTVRSNP